MAVAEVRHWNDVFTEMEKRKETILATIEEQGKLSDTLREQIVSCVEAARLEDLYLPYRPKRRTRATVAKEKGLEPLADAMYEVKIADPVREARRYVKEGVADEEEALAGARDIIAERLSESAPVRETVRGIYRTRRIVSSVTKAGKSSPEAAKYRSYFDFSIPLSRVPAHNLLAMLRAANEGYLNLKIDADAEKCGNKLYYDFCHERRYPSASLGEQIRQAVDDAYDRLLAPSITNEILKEAKEKADLESIRVFGENLRQLLLSAPVGQKRTLAIDPGFRNGCKTVCLDAQGNLLHHEIIFPHPPQNEKVKSITALSAMVEKYKIEVIAIGNGTASRETEDFVRRVGLPESVKVFTVSEDGASIYSASEVAREEFPDEDVTVDPKSLGVGQYQHDVDQNLLREKLDNTVVSCVNSVGVNLNTASPYLLRYVSGIGPVLAANIVSWRTEKGNFTSRKQLLDVPRLGAKVFEQCAGFLRIRGAANPLDDSAVHPERYAVVDKMAADLGVTTAQLVGNAELCGKIKAEDYVGKDVGLPTIRDILQELVKPGLDPRETAQEFSFAEDIHSIEDLHEGMELPGIVTNITNFGAFVDIGIHENGLLHASKMQGLSLKLHQRIMVRVTNVDLDRLRISLAPVR